MWGTSSPDDKLVSDLAKATEAIKIAARWSDRLMARKLSPLNCGLLQQNLPLADICSAAKRSASRRGDQSEMIGETGEPVAGYCTGAPIATGRTGEPASP